MSDFREKRSPSKEGPMHTVAEAKSIMRFIPRDVDESKAAWLRKVARIFTLTTSQAKKIEYEEVKDLRASRLDAMRAKLGELQEGDAKRRRLLHELDGLRRTGSNHPVSGGERTIPLGERSDRAGEGGIRPDQEAPAAFPRRR